MVAITDYMRAVPDQVARFVDRPYTSLGTDGFGRSDARDALRSYFEVDAAHLVVAVLEQLALGRARRRPPRWPAPSPSSASTPTRVPPFTTSESAATNVASASSAPSGTRKARVRRSGPISTATSKKAQHCFSR